jgi:hypothetical protein
MATRTKRYVSEGCQSRLAKSVEGVELELQIASLIDELVSGNTAD